MASSTSQQQAQQQTKASQRAADAAERRERLRRALPATVELLQSRQADRIDDADIDAYVSLNWLELARRRPPPDHHGAQRVRPVGALGAGLKTGCGVRSKEKTAAVARGGFVMMQAFAYWPAMMFAITPVAMAASTKSPPTPTH
ncbi:hypothetical protein [Variovorax sp. UC74_104]|uniref:hypothetical protein n=1 Tax=Variovorax sp. UC74_104 TaxID=3374555 RepID=UPI0037579603